MENKETASTLYFGVDLCKQAKNHVEFLTAVDAIKELKDPDVLRRAVFRYEKFWLPLASEHPDKCMSAPIDIEWVWHCHLLSPVCYEKDCKSVVGATVNHMLRSMTEFKDSQRESEYVWHKKYPTEPFHIDFSENWEGKENEQYSSKLSYNIVEAAQRQKDFIYKLSSPFYQNEKFLEHSLQRYKQFLYLETKMPQLMMVPANDIDLMWHTHQSNPLAYRDDTVRIAGTLLDHDDTDTDQSEGSALSNAAEEMKCIWDEFYKESLLLNLSKRNVNEEFPDNADNGKNEMGTCYNRCSVNKCLPDTAAENNEMGTCYNRCSVRKVLPGNEVGTNEMGTCYNRCSVRKAMSETEVGKDEMGTCYNRCSVRKALPETEVGKNEMGSCYNRCTIRKVLHEGQVGKNEMGTCYNRCTIRKVLPEAEVGKNEMGTCYNRCTIRKVLPETEVGKNEMGTCYNRCSIRKFLPETEVGKNEMGTCYNRCSIRKFLPETEVGKNEMGTCYNRCTIRKFLPETEVGKNEMGTCYNRCTIRKSQPESEVGKNEMGTCYNRCSVRKTIV